MPAKPKGAEPEQVSLGAEERRKRVSNIKGLDRELGQLQNSLLDAQARIPTLVALVANAREVIATNTAPVTPAEEG